MIIGLLSDTHGFFDETLITHFSDCDELWHAGDIGSLSVITSLEKMKPVVAVFGNIDDHDLRTRYPEDQWLLREGVNIWITHIAGRPPGYNPRVRRILKERKPDVLVCGHSHICEVRKDEGQQLLFINPGAAGQHGFHSMRTAMRLEVSSGKITRLEVIELGKRGKI